MRPSLTEGIGVFLKDHFLENLVLGDEVVGLNRRG